jgi:hypothetical protein
VPPVARTSPALAAALLLAAPSLARAQASTASAAPPPAERLLVYSPYEQQTMAEVLDRLHLARDPAPEGKLVERIEVVPLDPFEPRDVLPRWLNVFHVTSRPSVIRDEVLLREGGRYEQAIADDTIRNLRRLPGVPQLSAVIVVAAAGSTPDRVVVVVVTKDVWSLRLNWDVVADAGGIDQFSIQPSETNFLGSHQILGATFVLEPNAYTVGLNYFVPRLGRSRVALVANADVMVNRDNGSPEGTYGQLVAGQPLYSGATEWAWDTSVAWLNVVTRRYVNAQLSDYVATKDDQPDPACSDPTAPACRMPFQYRERVFRATYEVTRSFGWDVNHDFTLAGSVYRGLFQVNPPPTTSAQTVADFVSGVVPVSDTRVGPSLQYHTYQMRFVRVVDFDTLALQEDYRLGHDVVLRVRPTMKAFGSTRDVLDLYGAVQYTWALRDGLVRLSFQSDTQPQLDADRISDASLQPTAHLVTPTIAGLGRIVMDGSFLYRWRNYLNALNILGGDDRARGFPTNFFVGANILDYNVEARSRPVEILSCEVAGVVFYDVGDAYTKPSKFTPYHSVGLGLRTLFPWLDRTVFRADLGFPIERPLDPTGKPVPPVNFLVSFGQAFTTPTTAPAPVLPTGQGPDSP